MASIPTEPLRSRLGVDLRRGSNRYSTLPPSLRDERRRCRSRRRSRVTTFRRWAISRYRRSPGRHFSTAARACARKRSHVARRHPRPGDGLTPNLVDDLTRGIERSHCESDLRSFYVDSVPLTGQLHADETAVAESSPRRNGGSRRYKDPLNSVACPVSSPPVALIGTARGGSVAATVSAPVIGSIRTMFCRLGAGLTAVPTAGAHCIVQRPSDSLPTTLIGSYPRSGTSNTGYASEP